MLHMQYNLSLTCIVGDGNCKVKVVTVSFLVYLCTEVPNEHGNVEGGHVTTTHSSLV